MTLNKDTKPTQIGSPIPFGSTMNVTPSNISLFYVSIDTKTHRDSYLCSNKKCLVSNRTSLVFWNNENIISFIVISF